MFGTVPSVGASLLAIAVGQLAWMLDVPASSRASPLPHWIFSGQEIYVWHSSLCGSELARDSGGSACPDVGCTAAIAGKPCSHTGSSVDKKLVLGTVPSVGAKLARDSGGSACPDVGCTAAIAGKPCSHTGSSVDKKLVLGTVSSVGASLLAIAVGQLAWMLDVPASSRASPLPHWIFSGQEIYVWHSSLCGSELARDSGGSACPDVGCTAAIAGKPCSHTGSSVDKKLVLGTVPSVGAKLARDSGGSACPDVGCTAAIAGKPCSHTGSSVDKKLVLGTVPSVGAKLARDSGVSAGIDVGYAGLFAGKPCSHTGSSVDKKLVFGTVSSVGASLLAIAVGQLALMLDVPASSRASPLPHWIFSGQEIYVWHSSLCGSELARDSGGSACPDVGCTAAIAGKPCSHTGSSVDKKLVLGTVPSVGAKLARDSGGSACLDIGCTGLFAGKPAPTLDLQWARNLCLAQFPLWERACSR